MTSNFLIPDETWLRGKEAAKAIRFSQRTLRRRILDGSFVSGTHYIKSSLNGWYLFNVPACLKALGDFNGGQG